MKAVLIPSLVAVLLLAGACNLGPITPTPLPRPTATDIPLLDGTSNLSGTAAAPINPNCPATPPTWVQYRVETGDSLGLLALQTESTIQELMQGNCLENPDQIEVDTILYLPRPPVVAP